MKLRGILTSVVLCAATVAPAVGATTSAPSVKPEDLPRVPPTEAKDAVKTLKVRPGFHAELAAAEPNVVDPIAMCFDEDGRMFVVEMRDYSERRAEKLGRIRMLEDRDGDGVYETATIFLKDLPWPTAVMWVNGGLLVGACPDILFAKDTNHDGVADETKTLFTGFGAEEKLNVQGLFNNFQWGVDNRIHGCSGHDGGMVKQSLHPDAPPLDVRSKGFVIDPRDWSMTTEAGGGQYGLSFDHTGRLFTCENSSHCEMFMYDARYAARNEYVSLPNPLISIAADGPAAEVFRASPEEPWRVIRTRWRVAGLVGGPVEGGGRSAGYFTGATGLTIYKGDAFGPDYVGDAFVGDAGGNLVHHKRIRPGPDGITPVAERPADERKIEFLASTDNWFRPVDFANTPDGTLYVADMYREVIEHPWSLPPQIKQYLDLNSGNDRGRVWRIAPDGFKPKARPRLSERSSVELVKLLEHPNGWHRETAARLLFERQDPSAIAPLRELLAKSDAPLARMHALHALHGMRGTAGRGVDIGSWVVALTAALDDSSPLVREHALKLTEELHDPLQPPGIIGRYSTLADDADPRVRCQLAWTLGPCRWTDKPKVLARLARRDLHSPWTRAAILASLDFGADEVFAEVADDPQPDAQAFTRQLAGMIAARGDDKELTAVLTAVARHPSVGGRFALAGALFEGASRRPDGIESMRAALAAALDAASGVVADANAPAADRLSAVTLLGYAHSAPASQALLSVLPNRRSPQLQVAALNALDRSDAPELVAAVFDAWPNLAPRARDEAVTLVLKRPPRARELLQAIRSGRLPKDALSAAQVATLHNHRDPAIRQLAVEVIPPAPPREKVIESFRPALALTGDAARGHDVYAKRCVSCHRAGAGGTEGSAVGPDFTTLKNAGKEKLLLNILDPNREVAPQYVSYLIETKDGQDVLGLLANDTPSGLTVRQAYARETTIPRANIKRMSSQGKSLMPEGLEEGMKPQELADLIAFIEGVK